MDFFTKAYAAVSANQVGGYAIKAGQSYQFNKLVANIVNVVLLVAGILAVIYLVYAGIMYITANGDPAKATAARTGIINAIIGIIVILIAFSITAWVTGGIKSGAAGLSNAGGSSGSGGSGGGGVITTPAPPGPNNGGVPDQPSDPEAVSRPTDDPNQMPPASGGSVTTAPTAAPTGSDPEASSRPTDEANQMPPASGQ